MSNELTTTTSASQLDTHMRYAELLTQSDLVPQAYRGKPANALLAIGLGQQMGLSPQESLMRIDVIQGKPTASAELVVSNVRKAGHTLRLEVNEHPPKARCTIIRADDPNEYEHVVVRDEAWAKQMGLAQKDNYKKQPATMLGWRAATACARIACPETLYGVAYSSDELFDSSPRPSRHTATRGYSAPTVSADDFAPLDEDIQADTETGEVLDGDPS